MENSLKGLLLAAGTIITCIVISLGFFIAREARDTAAGGAGQISKLNAEFNESDKVMYDGLSVSGSEVINVINKFRNNELSVKVITNKAAYYYNWLLKNGDTELGENSSISIKEAQKPTSDNYINPNAQFLGTILRDVNNAIIAIEFSQID
ncbi:hypothetical protein [Anaeromicropila populeti]|uniref:Uncharacterized protein n=1 Tax=Anaeromicropila populeti TaxID=37658 RepID=A0A1I6JDB4_9FIRM|nr:hypothetical protein [Anaeromicropila populeti]SFR76966.1 hypothetical protein SAMN05661086_01586 [Anaeromicropila populeti]